MPISETKKQNENNNPNKNSSLSVYKDALCNSICLHAQILNPYLKPSLPMPISETKKQNENNNPNKNSSLFPEISEAWETKAAKSMAMGTERTKPLHNFSLPWDVKWARF